MPWWPRTTAWPVARRGADRAGHGRVPVSGQDGDLAALNRVALGTQTVSVWKDSACTWQGRRRNRRRSGHRAPQWTPSPALRKFTTPGGKDLNAIFLAPLPITKDNLNVVLDAGWITKDVLCAGVTGVAVCK